MNDVEGSNCWQDYAELKKMLRALGDVVRLNLVRVLARVGEVTVTDLAQMLLVSQPLVSWHLTMLRRVGLVQTRRSGRQVYCSLDDERFALVLRQLGEVIGAPAATAGETHTQALSGTSEHTPEHAPAHPHSEVPR